jgi:hypothetical protein
MSHPARCLSALALVGLLCAGCITRPVRENVYKEGTIEVFLRGDKRMFRDVEKGFQHPTTIAPVRLAHILARLDMRVGSKKKTERLPAIPTEMLLPIANGVSAALAKASENQEVVVMAIRRAKRLHIFDRSYLTSFVTYVRDDRLYVYMVYSDWEIPKRRGDRVPEPHTGDHPMRFRLYSGTAMALVNPQAVAVDWHDPVFRRQTRTEILPSGEVVRKNILLESPQEEWGDEEPAIAGPPESLSPEQLRALADIEEARRRGEMTESVYRAERRKILTGSE